MKLALLVSLAAFPAAPSLAQTVLRELGPFHESFGTRVASPGDVDGDGLAEIAASSPERNAGGKSQAGRVEVFSGLDGSPIWSVDGTVASARLGRLLAAAGDVNADGVGDLVVGSGGSIGTVSVLSGADGGLLHTFTVDTLVLEVSGVGDVDGDGRDDFAGGLYNFDPIVQTGIVRVWSGATGDVLHDLGGLAYDTTFGDVLAGPGDLDLDGHADVLGGSEFGMRVFSGASGALIHTFSGTAWKPHGAAPAGDADGDGVPDLLVGEPSNGRVRVVSGLDKSVLLQIDGGGLGAGLAALDDVDGDGVGELAYGGLHFAGPGAVRLASGIDGATVFTHAVPNSQDDGDAVARIEDLGGDGLADLVVGHPGGASGGLVYVLSSACAPGGSRPFCVAGANSVSSTGAKIGSSGSHSLAADTFTLEAWKLPPNQFGLFIWDRELQEVPLGDGTLCVGPTVFRVQPPLATEASGDVTLSFASWSHPFEAGDVIRFQFWYRDPAAGGAGFNATHGLRVTFCP